MGRLSSSIEYDYFDNGAAGVLGGNFIQVYLLLKRYIWRAETSGDPELIKFRRKGYVISKKNQSSLAKLLDVSRGWINIQIKMMEKLGMIKIIKLPRRGNDIRGKIGYVLGELVDNEEIYFTEIWLDKIKTFTMKNAMRKGLGVSHGKLEPSYRIAQAKEFIDLQIQAAKVSKETEEEGIEDKEDSLEDEIIEADEDNFDCVFEEKQPEYSSDDLHVSSSDSILIDNYKASLLIENPSGEKPCALRAQSVSFIQGNEIDIPNLNSISISSPKDISNSISKNIELPITIDISKFNPTSRTKTQQLDLLNPVPPQIKDKSIPLSMTTSFPQLQEVAMAHELDIIAESLKTASTAPGSDSTPEGTARVRKDSLQVTIEEQKAKTKLFGEEQRKRSQLKLEQSQQGERRKKNLEGKPLPEKLGKRIHALYSTWREEFDKAFPGAPQPKIMDGKTVGQIKNLIKKWDDHQIAEGIRYLLRNWSKLATRFKMAGTPGWGLLSKIDNIIIDAARWSIANKEMEEIKQYLIKNPPKSIFTQLPPELKTKKTHAEAIISELKLS